MTENIQTAPQSQTLTEIAPDQLMVQMRRIRRENPRLDLNQQRIAKELNRTQAAISKAMSHPHIYPELAKRVERYLNRLESSRKQVTTESAVGV